MILKDLAFWESVFFGYICTDQFAPGKVLYLSCDQRFHRAGIIKLCCHPVLCLCNVFMIVIKIAVIRNDNVTLVLLLQFCQCFQRVLLKIIITVQVKDPFSCCFLSPGIPGIGKTAVGLMYHLYPCILCCICITDARASVC